MKFHFTRHTIKGSSRRSGRLVLKRNYSNSLRRFCALEKNPEIDLFGELEEYAKKRKLLLPLFSFFKGIFKKIGEILKKRKRRPPARTSLILGAIFGVLSVSVIAGLVTVFSLFGAHFGKYEVITVPDLISLSREEALESVNDAFEYEIVYSYNPNAKADSIISQTPNPNVSRKLYKTDDKIKLTLVVNSEKEKISLPDLVGASKRDAELFLKNSGVRVKIFEEYSDSVAKGIVIACSHPEGSAVDDKETVVLRVSKGAEIVYVSIPDLCGLSEAEATEKIESLGFSVGKITYAQSRSDIGTVISQEYEKGTALSEGTKISIVVSGGRYFE